MSEKEVLDPVCGMVVDPRTVPARTTFEGEPYHFCATGCRDRFVRDPRRYLGDGAETISMDVLAWRADDPFGPRPGDRVSCPECGSSAERLDDVEVVGRLTMTEYSTVVRQRWRRRLGRDSYARQHSSRLIRALALHALKPESPVAEIALAEELDLEVARLRADGLNRAHVQRELYHLARAAAEVLRGAGLETSPTARMIETMDRRLVALLEWPNPVTE